MKQIVLCLIGILFASFVSAQKINHPSLLYTPQRIQQVKQRMQNEPKLQEAWEDIQKTADEALQKKDFNRWSMKCEKLREKIRILKIKYRI